MITIGISGDCGNPNLSPNFVVNKTEPESSARESNFCITKTTSGSIWLADSEGGNGTSKYPGMFHLHYLYRIGFIVIKGVTFKYKPIF